MSELKDTLKNAYSWDQDLKVSEYVALGCGPKIGVIKNSIDDSTVSPSWGNIRLKHFSHRWSEF